MTLQLPRQLIQSRMVNGLVYNQFNPWAREKVECDPHFFKRHSRRHNPKIMWLGCSDARLALYETMGLKLGKVFVCRNIANQASHTSARAAVSYAVKVLGVKQIIVCGHYRCGGVRGALNRDQLSDSSLHSWLAPLEKLANDYQEELQDLGPRNRQRRLAEINVWAQVAKIGRMSVVRDAWEKGSQLAVDGLVFDIGKGLFLGAGSVFNEESYRDYSQSPKPLVTLT